MSQQKKEISQQHTDPFTSFVTADWNASKDTSDSENTEGKSISKQKTDIESPVLEVYAANSSKTIAKVVLNGYNIEKDGSLGTLGAMRSFKVVAGDLWEQWNDQETLKLAETEENEAKIKIAALPTDDDGFGLIEFIP